MLYKKVVLDRGFEDFTSIQLKDHFNVLVVPLDHALYADRIIK